MRKVFISFDADHDVISAHGKRRKVNWNLRHKLKSSELDGDVHLQQELLQGAQLPDIAPAPKRRRLAKGNSEHQEPEREI